MSDPAEDATHTARPVAAPGTAHGSTVPYEHAGVGEPDAEPEPRLGPALHPGDLGRLGKYRVLKRVGQGGMGIVYLGFDEALRRRVALKVMLPRRAADPTSRHRFLREARLAAAIDSPHVVAILDVDEGNGTPFIVMDYLAGLPLSQFLATSPPLSVPQAVRIATEVARGLGAAHARGLIHRDIKPGNLWLEAPHGRIKVLDFGIARLEHDDDSPTQTGDVLGSPAYMSPEQARGERVDFRTDLFSLGVVLYRLLTGRQPFPGPTAMAVLTALATADPPPVRSLNPDVPQPLADLVHRLLAKDPAQRPRSADEVAVALVGGIAAVPAAPIPVIGKADSVWERIDEPPTAAPLAAPVRARRFPWLLASSVAAVVLLSALLAYVVNRPPPQQPVTVKDKGKDAGLIPKVEPPPVPRTDPDRKAAETLRAHGVILGLRVPDQTTPLGYLTPDQPLPDGLFTIDSVILPVKVWPERFVADVLIPAVAPLQGLSAIQDGNRIYELWPAVAFTPADLARLAECDCAATLQVLAVAVPLTPDTLDTLKKFRRLQSIQFDTAGIDDDVLVRLPELAALNQLGLRNLGRDRPHAERVFAALGKLPLVSLTLLDGRLSAAQFQQVVAGSPKLWILRLPGVKGIGELIPAVAKLPALSRLDVTGTDLADADLDVLEAAAGLRTLQANRTNVGTRAVKRFMLARQNCHVIFNRYDPKEDDCRSAADWVLANGGDVKFNAGSDGIDYPIPLPPGPFRLKSVSFVDSRHPLTDADLEHFRPCSALARFVMGAHSRVTDSGFETLSTFPFAANCTSLGLYSAPLTERALGHLARFPRLKSLSLSGMPIGDFGLQQVRALPALESLVLNSATLDETALHHLRGSKLDSLSLAGCKSFTDVGAAHVAELSEVRHLNLTVTSITDRGLLLLAGLRNLKNVNVVSTPVTAAGIRQFHERREKLKLPPCTIISNFDPKP